MAAPFTWNEPQKDLKLKDLVSLDSFKRMLSDLRRTHLAADILTDALNLYLMGNFSKIV